MSNRRREIIQESERLFNLPYSKLEDLAGIPYSESRDLEGLYKAIKAFPTSQEGDIALITWWSLYHRGKAPQDVRPSRGSTYRFTAYYGSEEIVRVNDAQDHRQGVEFIRFV